MTMFDRLPRQQMNPEAGMSQRFNMEEETPNNLTGFLSFLKGLPFTPTMPDRKMNIANIEDNAYEYQPRFEGPTGGGEYFNFGRNFEPSEGY